MPFQFDAKTLKLGLNFTLSTDVGDIDLLGEVKDLGEFDEVLNYSEKLELYGVECRVLSLEGLIKNKKAVGRPKDLSLIIELEALLEMKNKAKESDSSLL